VSVLTIRIFKDFHLIIDKLESGDVLTADLPRITQTLMRIWFGIYLLAELIRCCVASLGLRMETAFVKGLDWLTDW